MFKESLQRIFKGEEPKKEDGPDAKVYRADDYRDEFTKVNEDRLRELRRKQNSLEPGVFTDDDSKELLELVAKKESIENKPLSEQEKERLLELDKEKSELNEEKAKNNWTPKKADEWLSLDSRRKN